MTDLVSAEEIARMVRGTHHTPEDFTDGDLINRIYRYGQYQLSQIPIEGLWLWQFSIDDDLVATYLSQLDFGDAPPIVFDPLSKSIIDGSHRANAASLAGRTHISGYVGVEESADPLWSDDDQDE